MLQQEWWDRSDTDDRARGDAPSPSAGWRTVRRGGPGVGVTREATWSRSQGLGSLLLGLAFGGLLISAGKAVYWAQGGMATLASFLPSDCVCGAGMVASVNPCGVLLLPSLVAYYLGRGDAAATERSLWQRASKALLLSLVTTLGSATLLALVGVAIAVDARAVAAKAPIAALLVGVAVAGLGGWRGFSHAQQATGYVGLRGELRSFFFFGSAFSVTSLACTLPTLLYTDRLYVVTLLTLGASGPLAAASHFLSYALGVGSVLTAVILGAALFEGTVSRTVRGMASYVHHVAASFLVGTGLFVVNHWLTTGGLLR